MVGLASLPYPILCFVSHRAQTRPRKLTIQSSIRLPSLPSRLTKRKNYLRPKILKTLTKPYPIPPPTPELPVTLIEPVGPSVTEVPAEPVSENLDSGVGEQSKKLVIVDESNSGRFEAAQAVSEGQNVVGFSWFSGHVMVTLVAGFVGGFVVRTVVAVWMRDADDSDEKERNLGIEGRGMDSRLGIRKVEVGLNGNALQGNLANLNVDESEMESKIAEIRKMARKARELEKKRFENCKGYMSDVSGDDEVDARKTEAWRLRDGVVKEVDKQLAKLRKRASAPLLNVNFVNKVQDPVKNDGLKEKEENNMLMFEIKHRFKNLMTAPRDRPKGFQSIKGSRDMREKPRSTDDGQAIKTTRNQNGSNAGSTEENTDTNSIESSFSERRDSGSSGSQIHEKKEGSEIPNPLLTPKRGFGNNGGARKLDKKIKEGAKPERGVIQDSIQGNVIVQEAGSSTIATQNSQMKMSDPKASTTSEMPTLSVTLSSDEIGPLLSKRKVKGKQQIVDPSPWWSALQHVYVIWMQKVHDGALEGFYKLMTDSDIENQPHQSYLVAFEAPGDAINFSYILQSFFGELPDANIKVSLLLTKKLKHVAENIEVIVVKKGKLRIYAGQTLTEVETILRSLVK